MARTTAGQYQFDAATYFVDTLGMTEYPAFYGEGSQLLTPGTEYFALMVNQHSIVRTEDASEGLVELTVQLRLLYRFILNEDEYTNDSDTPSKQKAALALLMDEQFWRGAGALSLTAPLDVHVDEPIELELDPSRIERVLISDITVRLVTTSV